MAELHCVLITMEKDKFPSINILVYWDCPGANFPKVIDLIVRYPWPFSDHLYFPRPIVIICLATETVDLTVAQKDAKVVRRRPAARATH